MQVLALNAGSSSLKFRLFDVDAGSARLVDEHSADAATRARGGVSGFGSAAVLELVDARGAQRLRAEAGDAAAACAWILAALRER
jgi:acetate kinase